MKKQTISNWILVLILIAGLSLLIYPSASDYWNSLHQSRAIVSYAQQVTDLDSDRYDALWNAAWDYNRSLAERSNFYLLSEEQKSRYDSFLDVSGTGIMGYIEIPAISCSLPIYHGTEENVLQVGVGHLEWTSLPVGGAGSHCVLSGHRGLPSAQLFTHLDKLKEGDIFLLRVLNETLTYEVDQILIVLPENTDSLLIQPGEDLCTLVTCTPYGINTHRLLVRGHRIENLPEVLNIQVPADAVQIEPLVVAPILAAPMLLALLVMLMMPGKKKDKRPHTERET